MYKPGLWLVALSLLITEGNSQCLSGDCQNGLSQYRFQNGALYEGYMAFGMLDGMGILKYANGNTYKG